MESERYNHLRTHFSPPFPKIVNDRVDQVVNCLTDQTLVTSGPVSPDHTIRFQEIGPRSIKKSDGQPVLGLDHTLDTNDI